MAGGGDLIVQVLHEVQQLGVNMNRRFDEVDHRFEEIDHRFEEIDHRFDEIDRRFEEIDRRFEKVDQRFEQIDRRFDEVDRRLEEVHRRIDNTNDTLTLIGGVLHRAVETVKVRLEGQERRIRSLEDAHEE